MNTQEAIEILTNVMMVAKATDDTKTGLALTHAIEFMKASEIPDGGVDDKITYSTSSKYARHYITMEMRDPCGLDKNAKAFLSMFERITKLEDSLRWYGDESNYICRKRIGLKEVNHGGFRSYFSYEEVTPNLALLDKGQRAREVLKDE
jgi:hypothetical protein